jgi:hypothetical protein
MAILKRNMIELVKEIKEGELVTEKYLTPVFIPFSVVYEALDMIAEIDQSKLTEKDLLDKMIDFVASRVYNNQFSKEDLFKGLHAPDSSRILYEQILFITQGSQSDETKKFLARRN